MVSNESARITPPSSHPNSSHNADTHQYIVDRKLGYNSFQSHSGYEENQTSVLKSPPPSSSGLDHGQLLEAIEPEPNQNPNMNPLLEIPRRTLNSGHICPGIGYGTGGEGKATSDELYEALRVAIRAGFRSFDSAPFYQDGLVERILGKALKESGVARKEFFITTKVWPTFARCPEESVKLSLSNLQLDYVDCLLMHWPIPLKAVPGEPYALGGPWDAGWSFNKAWVKMQQIPTSLVRSIGVCNFTINRLKLLLSSPTTKVIPAVLQVESHPELPQNPLMDFCRQHQIQVFCFSPLAQGQVSNPTIRRVAQKHNTGSGQVAISWAIQRGTVPLPKSVNAERIRSNLQLVELDEEDFENLAALGKNPRRIVSPRILFGHDIFENNADSYDPENDSPEPNDEEEEAVEGSIPRKRRG